MVAVAPAQPDERAALPARILTRFDDDEVQNIVNLIEEAPYVKWVEDQLHKPRGRKRAVSIKAVFVGAALISLDRQPFGSMYISDALHGRVSPHWQKKLDIKPCNVKTVEGRLAGAARVARRLKAICALIDPSGLPKNRVLTQEELEEATVHRDPEEAERRLELMEWLGNAILGMSHELLPEELARLIGEAIAVDGTPVKAYAVGREVGGKYCSSDPDAGWHVRVGDHDGQKLSRRQRRRAKAQWAYEATIASSARMPGSPYQPRLALAFMLDRPGRNIGPNAIKALNRWKSAHPGPFWLAGDMAYSNSMYEKFQLPARALGAKLVLDYRKDQLGLQASAAGAILVDGTWYCPGMPEPLINATLDFYENRIDEDTWRKRIKSRVPYALWSKHRAENRFACPVISRLEKAGCTFHPETVRRLKGKHKIVPGPEVPKGLSLCTARNGVRIPIEAGAKFQQELAHASDEWREVYNHLRNGIEGKNGYVKDEAAEALALAGRRRMRGIAAATIAVGFLLFAANVRAIRSAMELIEKPAPPTRKRKSRRLEDFKPRRATMPPKPPSKAPPAAA